MNLKKLSYIIVVIVLSVSLFLGFIVDTFNVDVGYLNNVLKKFHPHLCWLLESCLQCRWVKFIPDSTI